MQKYTFGPFLCCIQHAKDDHTFRFLTNLTAKSWRQGTLAQQLDTLYRVGIKKYEFITQLDTMYRVCVHTVVDAHELDTLYRVGLYNNTFILQLDTLYQNDLKNSYEYVY